MSAILSINNTNIESDVLAQEDEKKVSAAQIGQLMTTLQSMVSSLTDQMVQAMESTSGTSESSTSMDADVSTTTTTDTTVVTETDETNTTSTEGNEESTASSGMTQTQQMAFALGEGMVQSVTGVCSTACENQSEQSSEV